MKKWEAFWILEWPKVHAYCWCCEYGKQQYLIDDVRPCTHCPIKWNSQNRGCHSYGSPYDEWNAKMVMWSKRVKFCEDEIKELSGLARKIANLPERA